MTDLINNKLISSMNRSLSLMSNSIVLIKYTLCGAILGRFVSIVTIASEDGIEHGFICLVDIHRTLN